jgi:TolB-like protein/DNA-binding winged helix-turn-helix (wHTH) protein/Flp pilus assembly protein TadD
MASKGREQIYRFADFILEASEHRLQRGDQEIYLRPKTFETLLYLVERHGHLVSKDALLDHVWVDTIVTETAMTHCIEEVRKALGDDAHNPRYLKTIPRMGYKFIAPVVVVNMTEEEIIEEVFTAVKVIVTEEEQESAGEIDAFNVAAVPSASLLPSPRRLLTRSLSYWSQKGQKIILLAVIFLLLIIGGLYLYNRSHPDIQSLAVLPLANLNADPAQDYFADGMTEALITELAKISAVRVISRTSVVQYKETKKTLPEIAHELKVDAIVEGSLLYSGDQVRINAQLLQANPERHLWAESYERKMSDILALQIEVTRAIASEINARLTPQEQTHLTRVRQVNPEAYQAYLKGRYFWNKRTPEGFNKGIEYFNLAISIDPSYAPAFAGLADCYNLLNDYDVLPPKEAIPRAKAAAEQALAIDSTLAEAHASLGFALARYDWDWIGAEHEFQRAIELKPNYAIAHHWYALQLAMMGRFQQAMMEMNKALELDPLSLIINANIGWLLFFERNYDQAKERLQRTLEMDPNFLSAQVKLGWVYEQQGMYEEAIVQFKNALALSGDDANIIGLFGNSYALSGNKVEAMKIINKLQAQSKQRYISPYWIANIYACLGEKDNAFQWLNKAFEERSGGLVWLKVEPKLDPLRSDPRFLELLNAIGLQ